MSRDRSDRTYDDDIVMSGPAPPPRRAKNLAPACATDYESVLRRGQYESVELLAKRERQDNGIPEHESVEEAKVRAANPDSWVHNSVTRMLCGTSDLWRIRCCSRCLGMHMINKDQSYRLLGRHVCIGTGCYNKLVHDGKVPDITTPCQHEVQQSKTGFIPVAPEFYTPGGAVLKEIDASVDIAEDMLSNIGVG